MIRALLLAITLCASLCIATTNAPCHPSAAAADSPLAAWSSVVSLAQVLDQNHYSVSRLHFSINLFPGDPEVNITIFDTIQEDGYKLERINSLGTHTGTHMSAPCHFLQGPQYLCIDQLPPSTFVFAAALIDVSARVAAHPHQANFRVNWTDILAYEASVGQQIPRDALVMLYTGFGPKFGTPAYAAGPFPGFSYDAVENLFKCRNIKGTASDTFGPDASDDDNFVASNTTYANFGVTIENMNNLVALKGRRFGDLVVAAPTKLKNGSGYQTNVLAFLGR